jgi:hypothetical protein
VEFKQASLGNVPLDVGALLTNMFGGITQELRNVLVRARHLGEQHVYVAAESAKAVSDSVAPVPKVDVEGDGSNNAGTDDWNEGIQETFWLMTLSAFALWIAMANIVLACFQVK